MCAETKKKPSKTAKPSSPTAGPAKTHDTAGAKSDARQSSPRCVTADVTAQAQAAQAARAAPRPSVAARRVDVTDLILARAPRPRTICAACGAPEAKAHCGNCRLAYCGARCQRRHWKSGGHRDRCDDVRRIGLDQYVANAQANAARERAVATYVAEAATAACGFCGKGGQLLRACDGCEAGAGFFHLECLAAYAATVAARDGARSERFQPWFACRACGDDFRGVGRLAVAREAWRVYNGLHPTDLHRVFAMNNLGDALGAMGLHRECLPVREDELAVGRVHFPNHTPQIEANLARCHTQLGNYAEALRLRRSVVAALQKREGPLSRMSLEAARGLANALGDAAETEEQRAVLRQLWPRMRRALGDAHATTLSCGAKLAHALVERGHACSDSVIAEAEDILWECLEAARAGGADDDVTAVALEKSLEETRRLYLAEEADDDGDKFT